MTTDTHTHAALGWQLDLDGARAYERNLVPIYFAPGAEALIGLTAPAAGERVLDLACGTGIVARRAAETGARVVGLDANEHMLAVARELAPDGIEWIAGLADELPFPDARFDVVLCQQAFQFFHDPRAALAEMRRVLAPGGRLAIAVMRPIEYNPGYVAFADALERHASSEAAAAMRSPFASWSAGELRDLVGGAGFRDARVMIVAAEARFPSVTEWLHLEGSSSPFADAVRRLEPEAEEALVSDMEAALRDRLDDGGVVFPVELYVTSAGR